MQASVKQRMIGAIFIISLGVILLPIIFDKPAQHPETISNRKPSAPALPDVSAVSKIHYVFDEPKVAVNESIPEPEVIATPSVVVKPAPHAPAVASVIKEKAQETLAQVALDSWTIQLGAFSNEKNAKELMDKLSQRGFNPYLRKVNKDTLVRVYVSPGVSRDQAVALTTKLDDELGLKGIVVRYFQ